MAKRYVYGTRSKKWHLVGESDRDYQYGFTPQEFKKIGRAKARKKYLQGRLI